MEIINAHVHLIEVMGMLREYPDLQLPRGISALADIEQNLHLLRPDILLKQMDEAGITRSVLYASDAPIIYSSNEYVAQICKEHPDRFIGFASVNPKRKDAMDVLKKAVEEFGLKGIKLHPPLQDFYPNDEKYYFIYEAAQKWGIPVVFHVGSTIFGNLCRLSQANPLLIDDVAVDFPYLRILMTHLGTLWQDETFMVVEKNPYVFVDTAAYLYEIPELVTDNLVARIGKHKIIFGTDYPQPSPPFPTHEMKGFVQVIKDLPLSEEIKTNIFSKNFEKLMSSPKEEVLGKPLTLKDMLGKIMESQKEI